MRLRRALTQSGFTLIELLVVVAIIALLIALLAPGLQKARGQAKQTVCLSNMKNMGLAAAMYADDHKDMFPLSNSLTQDGGWITTLEPYAGDKLLYRCPSDESTDWFDPSDSPADQLINDRKNSYAINAYMTPEEVPPPWSPDPTPKYGYIRRGLIKFPAETVHFGEFIETEGTMTAEDHIHADLWAPNPLTGVPQSDPVEEVAIGRHLDRFEDFTFADGHAERRVFETTFIYDEAANTVLHDQWNPGFRLIQQGSP